MQRPGNPCGRARKKILRQRVVYSWVDSFITRRERRRTEANSNNPFLFFLNQVWATSAQIGPWRQRLKKRRPRSIAWSILNSYYFPAPAKSKISGISQGWFCWKILLFLVGKNPNLVLSLQFFLRCRDNNKLHSNFRNSVFWGREGWRTSLLVRLPPNVVPDARNLISGDKDEGGGVCRGNLRRGE